MPGGNPKPFDCSDNLRPWKKGQSGNPKGKTSKQKRAELANARAATRIRRKLLDGVENSIDEAFEKGDAEGHAMARAQLKPDTLRLLKDSEDRGLGTPVNTTKIEDTGAAARRITGDMSTKEAQDAYAATLNPDSQ